MDLYPIKHIQCCLIDYDPKQVKDLKNEGTNSDRKANI